MRQVIKSPSFYSFIIQLTQINGVDRLQFYCNSNKHEPDHFQTCFKCLEEHIIKQNITLDKIFVNKTISILGTFGSYLASNYEHAWLKTQSTYNEILKLYDNQTLDAARYESNLGKAYTDKCINVVKVKYESILYLAQNIDTFSDKLVEMMNNGDEVTCICF